VVDNNSCFLLILFKKKKNNFTKNYLYCLSMIYYIFQILGLKNNLVLLHFEWNWGKCIRIGAWRLRKCLAWHWGFPSLGL
jgi:hypothetical protein